MNQPDQTDILAANERLTTELAAATRDRDDARGRLASVTVERDEAVSARDAARAQLAEATQSVGAVTQQLAAARQERDTLAAVDRDFNRRLAAELVKHGIRAEGVENTGATTGKALTLTEQCKLATGAKS